MSLKVIVPPAFEPVSLAEAKHHCRVDGSEDDQYFAALIAAAREAAEHETGRRLAPVTLERSLDAFPSGQIKLPGAPTVSVVSVAYVDVTGATTSLPTDQYVLDDFSEPGWLMPAHDADWPCALDSANSVRIRYTAGYENGKCPAAIKQWMLLQIGHWFKNREAVNIGNITSTLPFVAGLLDPFRIYD